MLDANELARRLRAAMDEHKPKRVSSAEVAEACDVTPQAVNGWRKTGRIAKGHLPILSRLTERPLEYFLEAFGEEDDPRYDIVAFSRGGTGQVHHDIPAFSRGTDVATAPKAKRKWADIIPFLGRKGGGDNIDRGPEIQGEVPLISWVQAGAFAAAVDNFQPGEADEWVPTTVPIHRHTYALRVKGDSMTNPSGDPTFPDGSIIIVEPDAITNIDEMVGRFVIVKRASDEETTFKKLVKDAGRYFLKPLNPSGYPMLPFSEGDTFCGVVREKAMRFF